MSLKLTDEQRAALQAGGGEPVRVHDEASAASYVLVDEATHERAMEALRRQRDLESVQRGIAQMEAGQGRTVDQSQSELRARLGLSQ
ncbi:MAG: hypothetical protein KDA41_04680 [Planctomycetales bacterium]|nr:hypothetical protein [Planctomycetales bacterium]